MLYLCTDFEQMWKFQVELFNFDYPGPFPADVDEVFRDPDVWQAVERVAKAALQSGELDEHQLDALIRGKASTAGAETSDLPKPQEGSR